MIPKGIIFDIDGVLEYHGRVCDGAVETVQALRDQGLILRFLTNSTLKSRASCASRLRAHGFAVADEEVFTASYLTAEYLRRKDVRSCWVMVDGEGMSEFQDLPEDREHPEYLVVGDNRSCFDFEHLNRALRVLLQGSKLIGMQGELLDTVTGEPELNVGSWVSMLERASGQQAVYIGKPNALAFRTVLESMRLPTEQVTVVGDQLSTDIAGAQRLGMRTVMIRGGEFQPSDAEKDIHPDIAIEGVGQLPDVLPKL